MSNLSRHPLIRAVYDATMAVEVCGASEKLTAAVTKCTALYPLADALLDERDALRAALRKRVVVIDPMCWKDDAKICELCHGEWAHPGPERHAPGCLAAPEDAP